MRAGRNAVSGIFLFGIFFVFLAGAVFGENDLTIDQAVDLALRRNLGLDRALIDASAKKRTRDNMWNVLVPDVEAAVTLSRSNDAGTASGLLPSAANPVSGGVYDEVVYYSKGLSPYNLAGSLSFRLDLSPATFTGMKLAVSEYEKGLVSLENTKAVLELNVRKAFFGLLLLEENINLLEQNIKTAEKRYSQAAVNYKNGLVPEVDMLSAKVSLENMRPSLDEQIIYYEEQLGNFKLFLGLDPAVKIGISGSVEPQIDAPDLDKPASAGLTSRLDIQELFKTRDSTVLSKKAAREQNLLPKLSLSWTYSPYLADPFASSGWKSLDNIRDTGVFAVSVSVPIDNLLPNSSARENIALLGDSLKKQESQILESTRKAVIEAETISRKLEKSRKAIDALQLNAALAQRTYELTEEAYLQGAKELLTLENAANELQSAKIKIVQEKYNYITLILDLEYALGVKFGTVEKKL
jgi:outer membrane protein TolC